jgi:hypothetical protein
LDRNERILRYGSPLYSYKNPALAPQSSFILDYETLIPSTQKYLPFNFLVVTNNGEADISIDFNDLNESVKLVPKGTVMTFENIWFRKLRVTNVDTSTTISANRIEFTAQRLPIKDELARTPDIAIIQKLKVMIGL